MTLQKPRDVNIYLALDLDTLESQPIMPKNLPETLIPGTKRSAKVSTSPQPTKKYKKMPVRTLSVHHRLRNGQAGRSSSRPPSPLLEKEAAVFALRTESPVSSSGMKVLSVLENTDQRYAL